VAAGLAYWLFATGTNILGAAVAATIGLIEALGAVVIAVAQWLGMALLVCCVAVVAFTSHEAADRGPALPNRRRRHPSRAVDRQPFGPAGNGS
jgi:hypothetical protein